MIESDTPVHDAFGATCASWFVIPRVILEAMPAQWQRSFVFLMDELNDTFSWEPDCDMEIRFRKNGVFIKVPEHYHNYRTPDVDWLNSIDRTLS